MDEQYAVRAEEYGITRAGFFWDYKTAPVPCEEITNFAEDLRSHMVDFLNLEIFYAALPASITNESKNISRNMKQAHIQLLSPPEERHQTVDILNKHMRKFHKDYHEDGCWIVLVTGDFSFYETINMLKYDEQFTSFRLVYNDKDNTLLTPQETFSMKKLAPNSVPLSYFLDLLPETHHAFLEYQNNPNNKQDNISKPSTSQAAP